MNQHTKDIWAYSASSIMIVTGIILSFISFFMIKSIHTSILIYVSEGITFFGAVYGLALKFKTEFGDFQSKVNEHIQKRFEDFERRNNHSEEETIE